MAFQRRLLYFARSSERDENKGGLSRSQRDRRQNHRRERDSYCCKFCYCCHSLFGSRSGRWDGLHRRHGACWLRAKRDQIDGLDTQYPCCRNRLLSVLQDWAADVAKLLPLRHTRRTVLATRRGYESSGSDLSTSRGHVTADRSPPDGALGSLRETSRSGGGQGAAVPAFSANWRGDRLRLRNHGRGRRDILGTTDLDVCLGRNTTSSCHLGHVQPHELSGCFDGRLGDNASIPTTASNLAGYCRDRGRAGVLVWNSPPPRFGAEGTPKPAVDNGWRADDHHPIPVGAAGRAGYSGPHVGRFSQLWVYETRFIDRRPRFAEWQSGRHKSNAAIRHKHQIELIASLCVVEIGKPHCKDN